MHILPIPVCASRYADCAMARKTEESYFISRQEQQADVYFRASVQASRSQPHARKAVKDLVPELKQTGLGTDNLRRLSMCGTKTPMSYTSSYW